MDERKLLREDIGFVSNLTINRPDNLNALDNELVDYLLFELDSVARDPSLHVVVLTGAGDRAFSAGADNFNVTSPRMDSADMVLPVLSERIQRLIREIQSFPKPVIAAVNGMAFGVGCQLAEAAYLVVSSDQAEFANSELHLGNSTPIEDAQKRSRHIGKRHVAKMMLGAEPISADMAASIGIVDRVVPHELLSDAVETITICLDAITRRKKVSNDDSLGVETIQFRALVGSDALNQGIHWLVERQRSEMANRLATRWHA